MANQYKIAFYLIFLFAVVNCQKINYKPTVEPADPFNPMDDANTLKTAIATKNEKTIIDVLTKRTTEQRLKIEENYKLVAKTDLVNDLKAKLDGKLEDVIVAMMTPLPEYYAEQLEKALARNEKEAIWVIVEVLFTVSDGAFSEITQAYKKKYGQDFVNKLTDKKWADMKALITQRSSLKRDDSNVVDMESAKKDALAIVAEGASKWGKAGSQLTDILLTRNYQQLAIIFEEYNKEAKKPIENAITKDMPEQIEYTLSGLVQYIQSRENFFADRFKASKAGYFSTNDEDLIRLVVTRSEVDLAAIKESYKQRHEESLVKAVKSETKGKYEDTLVALLGPEA